MAAKSQDRFNKKITITINGKGFDFIMTPVAYVAYVNDLQADDKVTPHHALCMATVIPEHKEEVAEFIMFPPTAMSAGAKLLKDYTGDVEVAVKK